MGSKRCFHQLYPSVSFLREFLNNRHLEKNKTTLENSLLLSDIEAATEGEGGRMQTWG